MKYLIPTPPHPHKTTTATDHHHTVQVAGMQMVYLHQWLNRVAPPVQIATGNIQHGCMWSISATLWRISCTITRSKL